jgi:hypothetical protein
MKPMTKILALTAMVTTIVILWLAPNINQAHYLRYTRTYEDTDRQTAELLSPTSDTIYLPAPPKSVSSTGINKVYKTQSIEGDARLKDIEPKMFSRSLQFEAVEEIPVEMQVVEEDSIMEEEFVSLDSIELVDIDTLAMLH